MPASKPECQRAVLMDLLHDSRIPNEYKKAVRWALCIVDTAVRERQDQEKKFREFLGQIIKAVDSWPSQQEIINWLNK